MNKSQFVFAALLCLCLFVLSIAGCVPIEQYQALEAKNKVLEAKVEATKTTQSQSTVVVRCNYCGGSAMCPRCQGKGEYLGGPCSACDGSGKCPYCMGKGWYQIRK